MSTFSKLSVFSSKSGDTSLVVKTTVTTVPGRRTITTKSNFLHTSDRQSGSKR